MNSFGQYLRSKMPFISSAPAMPPEQESNPAPDIDPTQAEAVFRSYHHRLGRPPTEEEFMASVRHYAQGGALQDGPQIAVGDYPPDSSPQLQQVAPTPMPGTSGRGLEEKLRPEDFASMLRQLELNYLRGRMGLETDYPRVLPQYQMEPYSNPIPPALEELGRRIFGPTQRWMDDMKERFRKKEEERPIFKRGIRG